VHLGFSVLLFLVIVLFRIINDQSVISAVFKVAGYTYGPLLGLFALGIFTKIQVKDHLVPLVVIISPILTWIIDITLPILFNGFQLGFSVLLLNGLITFLTLLLVKKA
jgi:hypothetical protein